MKVEKEGIEQQNKFAHLRSSEMHQCAANIKQG